MPSAARRLSLLVIDNDENVHRSLRALTISHPDLVDRVTTATDLTPLPSPAADVDAVILDFWLDRDSRASIDRVDLLQTLPAPVVLYTSEERPLLIRAAVSAGISAFCLKHDGLDSLVRTLECLRDDEPNLSRHLAGALDGLRPLKARLTDTEAKVLRGLAYGLEVPEIAERLFVEPGTVGTHEKHIHEKYRAVLGDVRMNRTRALRAAYDDGYWDTRRFDEEWNIPR